MDRGDGSTTLWVYLMPMNYTVKNGQNDEFYDTPILPQF